MLICYPAASKNLPVQETEVLDAYSQISSDFLDDNSSATSFQSGTRQRRQNPVDPSGEGDVDVDNTDAQEPDSSPMAGGEDNTDGENTEIQEADRLPMAGGEENIDEGTANIEQVNAFLMALQQNGRTPSGSEKKHPPLPPKFICLTGSGKSRASFHGGCLNEYFSSKNKGIYIGKKDTVNFDPKVDGIEHSFHEKESSFISSKGHDSYGHSGGYGQSHDYGKSYGYDHGYGKSHGYGPSYGQSHGYGHGSYGQSHGYGHSYGQSHGYGHSQGSGDGYGHGYGHRYGYGDYLRDSYQSQKHHLRRLHHFLEKIHHSW